MTPFDPGALVPFQIPIVQLGRHNHQIGLLLFPWASSDRKGGVKLYAVLDHEGCIPTFATAYEARAHVSRVAVLWNFPKAPPVFDKDYVSYSWFRLLGAKGVFFVTS